MRTTFLFILFLTTIKLCDGQIGSPKIASASKQHWTSSDITKPGYGDDYWISVSTQFLKGNFKPDTLWVNGIKMKVWGISVISDTNAHIYTINLAASSCTCINEAGKKEVTEKAVPPLQAKGEGIFSFEINDEKQYIVIPKFFKQPDTTKSL